MSSEEHVEDHPGADGEGEPSGPEPHPYVHEPVLYISAVPPFVTDEKLALAFAPCAPFRPQIAREGPGPFSGTIEFKFVEKAEKALAILAGRPIPGIAPLVTLVLSPYPHTNPPTPLPPPSATSRLVKHLPQTYTDSQLYDLFRPYGALASVKVQAGLGKDIGSVEFWREEDARQAEDALHCADVEGNTISVQVYQPQRRGPSQPFSAQAPAFVPQGHQVPYPHRSPTSPRSPTNPLWNGYAPPPRAGPFQRTPSGPQPFIHGPGQQVQLAPVHGPGSNSHSGLIDPCNLFCKNLDPSIDSNGLFAQFRQFGQIVSARVMRNENGESRGFGFVSYQTPEQAMAAMHAMNGAVLGQKQLVVRLHEPKQLRQEKLAARFGSGSGNGHPRSASGATSPTPSEGGESMAWPSPSVRSISLGSPAAHNERLADRPRRGSGSYYNAALTGTLNIPMRYDDLAALTPVMRKEILSGELERRIGSLHIVPSAEVDHYVEGVMRLSLAEILGTLQEPGKLEEQVEKIRSGAGGLAPQPPSGTASSSVSGSAPASNGGASQDARLLDATASAPEHPSTPVSVSPALSTPPRTASPAPSASLAPNANERERIFAAVARIETARAQEVAQLIMGLPKRERAMCLFNVEVLRSKVEEAKMVLAAEEDEEEEQKPVQAPVTPVKPRAIAAVQSPATPDLSSRGPSAAASPAPATPSAPASQAGQEPAPGQTHTLASLASLPLTEVVRLARAPGGAGQGLPLPKADALVVRDTDAWVDSLQSQPTAQQKQAVGQKLHALLKAQGFKRDSAKITVAMVDQEDVRSLAHCVACWPEVVKEKANRMVKAGLK
ncbi:hypothetical protein PENSPDRAFT_756207 [Peniophora sp. CONT]|nr:hypothetical protein PENSPDRAFT_756207 [Peniophora sp. CONT]